MAGGFMDEIKNSDLADKSVVAITADNNTMEGVMHYDDFLQESKQVPFYLYLPPYLRTDAPDVTLAGSQKDIFPTLYNRTLSGVTYRAIGSDLFDPNVLHCGFNTKGIILSSDGAFASGKAKTPVQQECAKRYKAALAITETWVTLQK
jgi:phosphoglycerol transferase MdoB-like AlkP superfamily enzyme